MGSANLCTFLHCFVAKLDENGTTAKRPKKDQTSKEDKSSRAFDKIVTNYATRLLLIKSAARK
jgi:hypothetical protein